MVKWWNKKNQGYKIAIKRIKTPFGKKKKKKKWEENLKFGIEGKNSKKKSN